MIRHERSVSTGSQPSAHRYSAAHANSSAFSASANPNEDWTKISDLAERRRIQNRIAQRNYRKKLKRRLEDLERRAASTSASPEPEPRDGSYGSQRRSPVHRFSPAPTSSSRYEHSPEPSYQPHSSERDTFMPIPDDRHMMNRSPPTFSYSSFGTPDTITGPYPHSPALSSYSVPSPALTGAHVPSYGNGGSAYLSPRIINSSASSPNDAAHMKQEYFDQGYSGAYSYGYGALGSYQDSSNSYTPEFSDQDAFDSFENSIIGSPPQHVWSLFPEPPPESPPFFRL